MSLPSGNFKKLELFYQSSNQLEEFKKRKQNHNNKKNPNGGMQQPETTEMAGKCYRTSTRNEFVEILRGFCCSLQGDSSDHSQGHQNSEKISIYSPLSTGFSPFSPFSLFFFFYYFFPILSHLSSPLSVLLNGLMDLQGQRALTGAPPWPLPAAPGQRGQGWVTLKTEGQVTQGPCHPWGEVNKSS